MDGNALINVLLIHKQSYSVFTTNVEEELNDISYYSELSHSHIFQLLLYGSPWMQTLLHGVSRFV